jgi:hypothetical protein
MKRQILLLASVAISSITFAQSKTGFGIKAGVVNAGIKGEAANSLNELIDYANGAITTNNRTGFFAGVNAAIPVATNISIEPGLYYSQKGYEMRGELNIKGAEFIGANAKAQLTSHYVDLPLLLKGDFNGFEIFAGPQVSYLTKADLRTTAGVLGFNVFNRKMDATEELNRWDAGIKAGVGYQFKNGFNISAAYDHGLSKLDANKNFDAYNRAIKVGVGFKF